MNQKSSKSKDYYGFSYVLVNEVGIHIVQPLANCINFCLSEGIFRSYMEISKSSIVFKKRKLDDPSSYRPISLVLVLGNIFEQLSLLYFDKSLLFAKSQFVFRKWYNTVAAVDVMLCVGPINVAKKLIVNN